MTKICNRSFYPSFWFRSRAILIPTMRFHHSILLITSLAGCACVHARHTPRHPTPSPSSCLNSSYSDITISGSFDHKAMVDITQSVSNPLSGIDLKCNRAKRMIMLVRPESLASWSTSTGHVLLTSYIESLHHFGLSEIIASINPSLFPSSDHNWVSDILTTIKSINVFHSVVIHTDNLSNNELRDLSAFVSSFPSLSLSVPLGMLSHVSSLTPSIDRYYYRLSGFWIPSSSVYTFKNTTNPLIRYKSDQAGFLKYLTTTIPVLGSPIPQQDIQLLKTGKLNITLMVSNIDLIPELPNEFQNVELGLIL